VDGTALAGVAFKKGTWFWLRLTPGSVRELTARLESVYGSKVLTRRQDPLDCLILMILSQATSDTNRDRAFRRLKQRFPRWRDVMEADVSEVADAIRPGGLAGQKAPRIRTILRQLEQYHGRLSLDFLAEMDAGEAMSFLQTFTGVGPKTAACVMLFAAGYPVFPVDTHINRILKRLGWYEGNDPAKLQEVMNKVVPPECAYSLHMNLIQHGREVCRAGKRRRCEVCVLKDWCKLNRRGDYCGQED